MARARELDRNAEYLDMVARWGDMSYGLEKVEEEAFICLLRYQVAVSKIERLKMLCPGLADTCKVGRHICSLILGRAQ